MTTYDLTQIDSFLDTNGRLTSFPTKYKKKLIALWYLSEKIEKNKNYSEQEINDILNEWTLFRDAAMLRRELYNKMLINRTQDCKKYWKEDKSLTLNEFVENNI